MRRSTIACALALAGLAAWPRLSAAGSSMEEGELANRLMEDSTALLDELLGPGKAKVTISVEGERTETKDQTQTETPIETRTEETSDDTMPGYSPSNILDKTFKYVQHDQQQSTRSGFVVNKINVSLLLDTSVPEAQGDAVKKILTDMLRLNVLRGDSVVVVRAGLVPPWRRLIFSPEVFKTLVAQGILAFGLILSGMMIYFMGIQAMRTLADAILQKRPAGGPELPGMPEPELLGPGDGPPGLSDTGEGAEATALGYDGTDRFKFLEKAPPQEVARILESEPVEEVALLFGWLADHQPEPATVLFSTLPPSFQLEVSKALVKLRQADPERIGMLEGRLRSAVESRLRGTDKLGRILSRLGPQERENLLGDLSQVDAEAMLEIQKSLVTFEDVAAMKLEDLRRIVIAVSSEVWAQALRGADPGFAERVVEMLPEGMRVQFRESMDVPQPKEKVLEARSKILSAALALSDQHQIALKGGEKPPEVV